MKLYIKGLLFLVCSFQLGAQTTIQPRQMDYSYGGILYTEETSFQGGLHSSGIYLGYRKGVIKKYYLTTFYHLEIANLKHPKEYHQSLRAQSVLHNIPSGNGFTYGKQNSFFALRGGLGAKRYYSEKTKRKGVSVALSYEGGPSLGVVKPYYLDLSKFQKDRYFIEATRYSEKVRAEFLDLNKIAGSSSILKGLTQISVIPGIQGKAALNFSFGDGDQYIKSFEAGLAMDVYLRKIPIMVETPNTAYFINFFLGIDFGKRK